MERLGQDDDLDPELILPAADGDLDDPGETGPTDDTDYGLANVGENEEVGLDIDTGPDEPLDYLELGDISESAESEKWTLDSDPNEEMEGTEGIQILGDENGWTKDNEPPDLEDWIDQDLFSSPASILDSDDGSEGLDEDQELYDLEDSTNLPPLDMENDEEDSPDTDEDERFGKELLRDMVDIPSSVLEGE